MRRIDRLKQVVADSLASFFARRYLAAQFCFTEDVTVAKKKAAKKAPKKAAKKAKKKASRKAPASRKA